MRSNIKRIITGIVVTLGSAVALALLPLLLVIAIPGLGRFVLGQVLVRGARMAHIDVRFERIEGSILRNVSVVGLTVKAGPDSFKVRKVTLTYDPVTSVVKQALTVSAARLVEPEVYISTSRPAAPAPQARARPTYPVVRVGQLRILGGAVFVDTSKRFDSLDLTLGLVSTKPQVALQVIGARGSLVRESIAVRNLSAYARLTPDSLIVTQFNVMTRASRLQAGMRLAFEPSGVAAELQDLSIDLPEWSRYLPPGIGPIPGTVNVSGKASLEHSVLAASVNYRTEGVVWSRIELPPLAGRTELKDSTITLNLSGSNPEVGGASVAGRLDLGRLDYTGRVDLYNVPVRTFASALPDFRFDAGVDIAGRAADSVSVVVSAAIPDLGIDSLSAAAAWVAARHEARLERLRLSGPVGVLRASGTLVNRRVDAELAMERFDLGVIRRFDTLAIGGLVSGNLRVSGTLDTIDAAGVLDAERLVVAGASARRIHADIGLAFGHELSGRAAVSADTVDAGGVRMDSIRLAYQDGQFDLSLLRPDAHIHANGQTRLSRGSMSLDVAALRVEAGPETVEVANPLQMSARGDSLLVHVEESGIAGGDLHLDLFMRSGVLMMADMQLQGLDLARLKRLLHLDLEAAGILSLTASGTDTLSIGLAIDGLAVPAYDAILSRVDAQFRVTRDRAFIDRLWLVNSDSGAADTSMVSGSFGFSTDSGFRLGAADIKARLRNPGAWVVWYLKPTIELQRGELYGDLTLKGDPLVPALDGRVRISRATISAPVVGAAFDRVNAELVFSRNRVSIEKLSGRSGQGTTIVNGFVDLGRMWQVDSLRFSGQFTGTTINPQPELYAVIDGDLNISWGVGRPFSITGTADVQEALVAFGLGQSTGAAPAGPDTTLVFNIRVRGDRDIWLRSQGAGIVDFGGADIEFGGDMTIRKTRTGMLFSGELVSRQGVVYYLDQALRVTKGSVKFQNIATVNPDLDITAELPVRAAPGDAKVPDKIVLSLTGTIEKPVLGFTSVPPMWDTTQVLSYLSLSVTPDQFDRQDVTKLLSQRLSNYFLQQVSRRARGFVKVDYLQLESGLLGSGDTRVTVGKYIGRNLYVAYTQNFTGNLVPLFRVEYYINRKNQIVAESKEQNQQNRYSLRYLFKLRY